MNRVMQALHLSVRAIKSHVRCLLMLHVEQCRYVHFFRWLGGERVWLLLVVRGRNFHIETKMRLAVSSWNDVSQQHRHHVRAKCGGNSALWREQLFWYVECLKDVYKHSIQIIVNEFVWTETANLERSVLTDDEHPNWPLSVYLLTYL